MVIGIIDVTIPETGADHGRTASVSNVAYSMVNYDRNMSTHSAVSAVVCNMFDGLDEICIGCGLELI